MAGLKRVSPRNVWIWIAVFLPFTWQFLGAVLDFGLGGSELLSVSIGSLVVAALLAYPSIFFFGGPLNEEPGWRGFATPKMQQRFTPLITGLFIGVVWTFWHFPLHLTTFYGDGVMGFLFRFIFNVPLGILFTWYYNRSNGNLFGCILLHTSVNVASGIFGANSSLLAVGITILFTIAVIFMDKMYRKNKNEIKIQEKEPANLPVNYGASF
jgi:membrane protease YdiL (CAAX protease family)